MAGADPNSYMRLSSWNSDIVDIIVKKIRPSIDRLILTRVYISYRALRNYMKHNSLYVERLKETKSAHKNGKEIYIYRSVKCYLPNNQKVTIRYCAQHLKYKRVMLTLIVDDPDTVLIDLLADIFEEQKVTTVKVSKVEFAWDFYTDQTVLLKEWVKQHLWLYHNRKGFFTVQNTYYLSNPRGSVKGVRVYLRPKDSHPKQYLRVEIEFHRQFFLKADLHFPFTAIDLSLEFTKYIRFCEIDWEKVTKAYLNKNIVGRDKINFKATHPIRKFPNRLLISQLKSDITDIQRLDNLVLQMETIKKLGLSNHSRFLKPMKEWDWIFNELPHEQGFNL